MSSSPRTTTDLPPTGRSLRLVRVEPEVSTPARPRALLRAAALRLDRIPGTADELRAERALQLWEELLCGRLSMVDWFDAGGRRLIVVKVTPLADRRPRRLTLRERQVTLSASLGESSKLTGYTLGISPSRVSALLRGAMRKLGVRNKSELVVMVRLLGAHQSKLLAESMSAECHA